MTFAASDSPKVTFRDPSGSTLRYPTHRIDAHIITATSGNPNAPNSTPPKNSRRPNRDPTCPERALERI
ncbi:hypothetical protein GCM10009754_21440 [Amycolatopsis minnesotensis]|uniref:Uncharacterized protein n=1 Tax=Amycolatopsis minnesotensis TaxID=337894 RepID=A0ABN2QHK7_9PSEU